MTNAAPHRAEIERVLSTLPEPVDLRRALTDRVNGIVADGREARRLALGPDHEGPAGPDAVRPLGLELAVVHERLHEYAAAIEGAARTALGHLGDEQREAVGATDADRSAEPLHLLADDGSTWMISDRVQAAWATNDDNAAVYAAVAEVTLAEHAETLLAAGIDETETTANALRDLLVAAMNRLGECGKVEPQVTKIRGKGKLADQAARVDAATARAARESMYRTERVTGTKVDRDEASA